MATDWTAVEQDYIGGGGTYTDLAGRYGLSVDAVAYHGRRYGWVAKRRARQRSALPKRATTADAAESVAGAPDDGGRPAAALRGKLLALADRWTEEQDGQIRDVADYRRMVQSVLELSRAEGETAPPEVRVVMDVPEGYGA